MAKTTREHGTVKRLVNDRGFGFIAAASGDEFFFHRSACDTFDGLRVGSRVSFTPSDGTKGPRAEDVTAEV